jgi:hypothetical protein
MGGKFDEGCPVSFLALPPNAGTPFIVAVNAGGSTYASFDGINWFTPNGAFSSAAAAAGGDGKVVTAASGSANLNVFPGPNASVGKSDGTSSWTTPPSVAYGNNTWSVVHGTSSSSVSSDGLNWTAHGSAGGGGPMTFGASNFVMIPPTNASTTTYNSPDGVTWTARGSIGLTSSYASLGSNGSTLIAIPTAQPSVARISTNDGVSWTGGSSTVAASNDVFNSIAYGNGVWVSGTLSGVLYTSSNNGLSWSSHTPATGDVGSVAYFNGLFIAMYYNGVNTSYVTSPDGATWTVRTFPTSVNGFILGHT